MATTSRQTAIFGTNDWKQIYQSYSEANFQSYNFETIRKCFIDQLKLDYPETFTDYIESSEMIALLDLIAFMGQSLAFRTDLNTRENYIDTAERRDSVVKLANLVSYTAKRNTEAHGYLKIFSVNTTENVFDYNGTNLSNITVNWADPSNFDWQEQWTAIINASLVNTQRIGRPANSQVILGVRSDEYTVNLVTGYLPIVPYTATIDGVNMPFEAVDVSSVGAEFVYEPSPIPNGSFNILFRNDQLGYASPNTGYFFYFKQGILQNQDFNLPERIANRTVEINIEGVNNTDIWLFQLDNVGNITREWTRVENVYAAAAQQTAASSRAIYSVTSRTNDQITLVFGDGVFSEIPVGYFRCYVRASNGLTYIINPEEMQSVSIPINYISRNGQVETITFTCGITEPVTNAQARETLAEIKQRAPARYYTQNRMVNGEDYTNFPYTNFNSIIKSSAINRSSIGTSRYLDLVDNTGKYSSTDSFASDGALFENNSLPAFSFTWNNSNDVYDIVANRIQPLLSTEGMTQFYRANFPRPPLLSIGMRWHQSTHLVNETTGYFVDAGGDYVALGPYYATDNAQYVREGCLIQFVPPPGYYFNEQNNLIPGVPTRSTDKTSIWATPTAIYLDGTGQGYGNLPDGTGPVVMNTFVPDGAIANLVIPIFVTDLGNTIIRSVVEQVILNRNFGLGYNNLTASWYLITASNLDEGAAFSLAHAEDTSGAGIDASWLIQATTQNGKYTVVSRSLDYYFGSVIQTRFFFYTAQRIYDSRTGTVIQDYVKVLKTNSQPDSNLPLAGDVPLKITGQPILSDGYVDDFSVTVSYYDSNSDGAPDNPDFFNQIVAPDVNPNNKLVFFQQMVDFDNLQRYVLLRKGVVNDYYATKNDIELALDEYLPGQVFYAWNNDPSSDIINQTFYEILVDAIGVKYLVGNNTYLARVGRQDLGFQYRHNSPLSSRIDPGTTNVIDIYVATQEYYTAYTNWLNDSTGTVVQPLPPSIDQLTTSYSALQEYKMISDNLIVNSVVFKPLYGAKAAPALRGVIKVIKAPNSTASDSEIKNLVVNYFTAYFSIENINFGQTIYFSEIGSFIHQQIGDVVSSVVLVPLDPSKSFGDLMEIRCAPYEIAVSAVGVDDVEIITALTSTNLQTAPGSGVI